VIVDEKGRLIALTISEDTHQVALMSLKPGLKKTCPEWIPHAQNQCRKKLYYRGVTI